jgi:hypothetical protein
MEDENKPQENSKLNDVIQAAERLEKANKEMAENLRRQEELQSRAILGGLTDNAKTPVVKEETPKEYKDRILRGL